MRTVHVRSLFTGVLVTCALAGRGAARAADEKPTPSNPRAANGIIYRNLREVVNRGADLYNPPRSDHNGCYRLYEGALMMVRSSLDHEARLQKDIDAALASARRMPTLDRRAFVLREVIDQILTKVKVPTLRPGAGRRGPPPLDTLWGRLGGKATFTRVVDDFTTAVLADPKVNFDRGGKFKFGADEVARLKSQLIDLGSTVSGGPPAYKGKTMLELHKGMDISDVEFDALLGHLKTALEKQSVKPDDISDLLKKVEGTRKNIVERQATLWGRLGGKATFTRVVDDFTTAVLADPKVNFDRGGKFKFGADKIASLKSQLVDLGSTFSGGPPAYKGKTMLELHKGMGITGAEFDALVGHLKAALKKHGVKPDDVEAVLKAVERTRKNIVEK